MDAINDCSDRGPVGLEARVLDEPAAGLWAAPELGPGIGDGDRPATPGPQCDREPPTAADAAQRSGGRLADRAVTANTGRTALLAKVDQASGADVALVAGINGRMDDPRRLRQCVRVVEPASAFADSPVDARLAVALIAVERFRADRQVELVDLDALIEHLWAWLLVDERTFPEWHAFDGPLLEAGLGGELPSEAREAFAHAGLSEEMARRLLGGLVEIVYWNLFGAIDDGRTQAHMESVAAVLAELGISWPSRSQFTLSDGQARPSAEDLARWRGTR